MHEEIIFSCTGKYKAVEYESIFKVFEVFQFRFIDPSKVTLRYLLMKNYNTNLGCGHSIESPEPHQGDQGSSWSQLYARTQRWLNHIFHTLLQYITLNWIRNKQSTVRVKEFNLLLLIDNSQSCPFLAKVHRSVIFFSLLNPKCYLMPVILF